MMTINALLILARKHLGTGAMDSSARLCLCDAIQLMDRDEPDYDAAWERALRSLAYSVGIWHKDYRRAVRQ